MSDREVKLLLEINKLRAALRAVVLVAEQTADTAAWNPDQRKAVARAKELAREDRTV